MLYCSSHELSIKSIPIVFLLLAFAVYSVQFIAVKSFLLFLWSYRVFRYLVFLNLIVNFYAVFEEVKEKENANYQVALFCGSEEGPTKKSTNSPIQQNLASASVSSSGNYLDRANAGADYSFDFSRVQEFRSYERKVLKSSYVDSSVNSRAPPFLI